MYQEIKRADDIDPDAFDNGLDDDTFEKIIACIRIAVPYTGMIISTRESQEVRERALKVGISQISGASRTSVGGYTEESDLQIQSSLMYRIKELWMRLWTGSWEWDIYLHFVPPATEKAEQVTDL